VVDIGINITHKALRPNWKDVVRRAVDAGVHKIVLTGTSVETSRESLALAHEWQNTEGTPNLVATVGVHPHEAKSWNETTLGQLRELLEDPLAVAVGECGLDYHRNFSSNDDQILAFREQVRLAQTLGYPIFVHEREAHGDLLKVLDEVVSSEGGKLAAPLPKIVVHCFTGTQAEASTYISRGYYIGFTGTICKKERGEHLRALLPSLPLENLMVETDAPYMAFKTRTKGDKKQQRKRRHLSEPEDCVDVARQLSATLHRPFEEVCAATTRNANDFFRLPDLGGE